MKIYFTRLWAYHQRFFRLYLLLFVAIYGIYLLHLPTPLSLILKPFGIKSWSAGLTRASVRLLHLDWQGAWDYNPLIYPLVIYIFTYIFLFPILSDKKVNTKVLGKYSNHSYITPIARHLHYCYNCNYQHFYNQYIWRLYT